MSEVMLTEQIAEAEWLLKRGYWTQTRFPYKLNRNWSDIDVIAYNPETKHLVICESKVQGKKTIVRHKHKEDDRYLRFIGHIPKLAEPRVLFGEKNFYKMVRKLTIKLVSNLALSEEDKKTIESDIQKELKNMSSQLVKGGLEVKIETTIDVLAGIIEATRNAEQGRRYGHPVLDLAREINRYAQSSRSEELMDKFQNAISNNAQRARLK